MFSGDVPKAKALASLQGDKRRAIFAEDADADAEPQKPGDLETFCGCGEFGCAPTVIMVDFWRAIP